MYFGQLICFWSEMYNKISHLKELQGTTPSELGALTSIWYTRTLCLPPTRFLFMWLQKKIPFAAVVGTQITRFLIKMHQENSYSKWFQQENSLLVGCSSLHIVYKNLVLPSYHFFCSCGWRVNLISVWWEVCTQIVIFLSKMHQEISYSK